MAERRGLGSLAGSVERRQISPAGRAPQTYPTRSCATRDSLVPRRSDAVRIPRSNPGEQSGDAT